MNSQARLASAQARNWVQNYSGKNIVRGYRRWFGVDALQAIVELRKLGVTVSVEYENQIRKEIKQNSLHKRNKREKNQTQSPLEFLSDLEAEFEFVAGYTSAGFPYGTFKDSIDDDAQI